MPEQKKEVEQEVDSRKIEALLLKGKDHFFGLLDSYVADVKTLTESMHNLYMADDDTKMALAMLGCVVHVRVECKTVGLVPFDVEVGGRMEAVKKDELQTTK